MCLRFLRHGETEALGIKQNQLEALRGGFKLGRGARKRGRLLMQNIKSRRKRCIACDVVEHPANFEDKETTKSKPNEVGSICGRRLGARIWSFNGSYANRESGMEQAQSEDDERPWPIKHWHGTSPPEPTAKGCGNSNIGGKPNADHRPHCRYAYPHPQRRQR